MRETLHSTLLSLFSVAYKCRCTLPILVSVGFMLLDVNIRLEFQVLYGTLQLAVYSHN